MTAPDKVELELERVADELRLKLSMYFFHTFDQGKLRDSIILPILRRELGEKLRAGWAMRDVCAGLADKLATAGFERTGNSVQEAWDAAWQRGEGK